MKTYDDSEYWIRLTITIIFALLALYFFWDASPVALRGKTRAMEQRIEQLEQQLQEANHGK